MRTKKQAATEAEARALASAVRLRIIRLCIERSLTNKEIAGLLESNPATTLHHVRTLVATGFLVAQEPRRGNRGAREVPYRSTDKSWTLNLRASGVGGQGRAMLDAFLTEVALVDEDEAGISRLGVRLTEAEYEELMERLDALLDEYKRRPRSPDGHAYSIFLSVHRDVTRDLPTLPAAS